MRRLVNTLLTLAALSWCSSALAVTVAIVRPAEPSPALTEALGRLRGELTSVGFSTEFIDLPTATDEASPDALRPWLEELAERRDLDAVVAILGGGPDSVEVWVVDEITGKSVVRTVAVGTEDTQTPDVISVRAMELLRSSLLEIELIAEQPRAEDREPPPPTVLRYVEMERRKLHPKRFAVELGGLTTMTLDGVGPALLPALRLDLALEAPFAVHLELSGLGTRPTFETSAGRAQLGHSHVLFGASYGGSVDAAVRPVLSLSAGALYTTVDGFTDAPTNQGHSARGFSLLFDAGVGAQVALHDRLFLSLSGRAQLAEPAPAVRFVGEVITTWAQPNLGVGITVGTWL